MAKPYVGNKATGVLHKRHSKGDPCRVAEILPKNRVSFETLQEALDPVSADSQTYRPCKKCLKDTGW